VLAPNAFSRNRFFSLFEEGPLRRARKRAKLVRGIVRQLSTPQSAEVTGKHVLEDGRVLLRYSVGKLRLERTTALSPLEAAVVDYALQRAGVGNVSEADSQRIESTLARLGDSWLRHGASRLPRD
jgi:hypothetical protein